MTYTLVRTAFLLKRQKQHMLSFIAFVIIVMLYIAFLLWCFFPIFENPFAFSVRPLLGVYLLAVNIFYPFILPIQIALLPFWQTLSDYATAVAMFPKTLPAFTRNVVDWNGASATLIEVTYPIDIAGVRYSPSQQIACTAREMYSIDKGIEVNFFKDYPTAIGSELVAGAGNVLVVTDHSQLCGYIKLGRLRVGAFSDQRNKNDILRSIYVLRFNEDSAQQYSFNHYNDEFAIDGIVLHSPQIVRIEQKPTRDVIPIAALWPMSQHNEMGSGPTMISELIRMNCTLSIYTWQESKIGTPKVSKSGNGSGAANGERCRQFIERHLKLASPTPAL